MNAKVANLRFMELSKKGKVMTGSVKMKKVNHMNYLLCIAVEYT